MGVRSMSKPRALPTNSTRWRAIRAFHIAREPLCRDCSKRGLIVAGTDVDHVDGDNSNHSPENLQTLCKPCHSRKTASEQGGFGNKPGRARKRGCDADGNPWGGWERD
jgi:5-methylcytosine-specific restriction enzyme A